MGAVPQAVLPGSQAAAPSVLLILAGRMVAGGLNHIYSQNLLVIRLAAYIPFGMEYLLSDLAGTLAAERAVGGCLGHSLSSDGRTVRAVGCGEWGIGHFTRGFLSLYGGR